MYSLQKGANSMIQKRSPFAWLIVVLCVCFGFAGSPESKRTRAATASAEAAENSTKGYLGRWDLTLKAPDREYPSWLELHEENGTVKAEMVGRWGNARPLPKVEIANGKLTFVSPKEEEDSKADLVFEGTLKG